MKAVTLTEFRNNARKYFDEVERGEQLEVYRHGKPVAVISPAQPGAAQYWRTERPRPLRIRGAALSAAIVAERAERYRR